MNGTLDSVFPNERPFSLRSILNVNRQIAGEISPGAQYAEAFELELYGMPVR
jgi:hypothetical protein